MDKEFRNPCAVELNWPTAVFKRASDSSLHCSALMMIMMMMIMLMMTLVAVMMITLTKVTVMMMISRPTVFFKRASDSSVNGTIQPSMPRNVVHQDAVRQCTEKIQIYTNTIYKYKYSLEQNMQFAFIWALSLLELNCDLFIVEFVQL